MDLFEGTRFLWALGGGGVAFATFANDYIASRLDSRNTKEPPANEAGAEAPAKDAGTEPSAIVAETDAPSLPLPSTSESPTLPQSASDLPDTSEPEPATLEDNVTDAEPVALEAVATFQPRFDTIRVEPDGSTVVAGSAVPGAEVEVRIGNETVETVQADGAGAFVSLFSIAPSDTPQYLSLFATPGGDSADRLLIAPIAAPAPAADDPETPVLLADADPAPDLAPIDEVEEIAPPAAPQAPALRENPSILVVNEEGVALAAPSGPSPQVQDTIALDTISYDAEGAVQIAGRAVADGSVRIFLDGTAISEVAVSEGRGWRADLPSVDTGIYALRIEEVDNAGSVVSTVETPFKREAPEKVVAALEDQAVEVREAGATVLAVQPGNTLWAIAEERYGKGLMYVQVYDANRAQIDNPDLIYPGQVFVLPQLATEQSE